jgi:hypothetical protein
VETLRNVVILILVLAFLAVAVMYGTRQCSPPQEVIELPLDLADIIPETWEPQDSALPLVDIDGDGEREWLLIYRYDSPREGRGPIGGVIYDAQVNLSPHAPGQRIPYRSAFLVPYSLLPDTRAGKGQGYLADTRVDEPVSVDTNGDGDADELIIAGYGRDPAITRLSIFRWQGLDQGYSVQHFQGSGGIVPVDSNEDGVLEEIIVLERMYERSQFCRQQTQVREGNGRYSAGSPSLVFCYGTPDHPFYPEGVVLAFLLSSRQQRMAEVSRPDGEPGLLTVSGRREIQAQGLHEVRSIRVLQFTYPGVAISSSEGLVEVDEQLLGAESVEIWTEVATSDGGSRTDCWEVLSTSSERVHEDTAWRINGLCTR